MAFDSFHFGARTLARGLRTSRPAVAAWGAALLAWAAIRAGEAPKNQLVYRVRLRPGESVQVLLTSGEPDPEATDDEHSGLA